MMKFGIHVLVSEEHSVSIFREMLVVPMYQTTVTNLLKTKCCFCKNLEVTTSERWLTVLFTINSLKSCYISD